MQDKYGRLASPPFVQCVDLAVAGLISSRPQGRPRPFLGLRPTVSRVEVSEGFRPKCANLQRMYPSVPLRERTQPRTDAMDAVIDGSKYKRSYLE